MAGSKQLAPRVDLQFSSNVWRPGDVTLTTTGLLGPHLTPDNHRQLLDAARHKSKREVEHLVAALRPQAAVPSSVRKLPSSAPDRVRTEPSSLVSASPIEPAPLPATNSSRSSDPAPRPATVKPLDPARYRVQFTVAAATFEKLHRVQDLMRHQCPSGDLAVVFERALTLLLEHLERTKLAQVSRSRESSGSASRSRRIPAAVRRAVWTRDEGQCAFVGARGRCTERGFLEFHHVVPFADGGASVIENIQLRCRAHNQYESDL